MPDLDNPDNFSTTIVILAPPSLISGHSRKALSTYTHQSGLRRASKFIEAQYYIKAVLLLSSECNRPI